MHHAHGGVEPGALQREQVGQWAADGDPAPDDHDMTALDRDVVGVQQLDDAGGRAGQRARCPEHQAAEVHGMQTVDVLVGVDGQQGAFLVEARGQRELDQEGADLRVRVEARDGLQSSCWVAVAGRCSPTEWMPSSAQSSCFSAT